MIKFLVGLITTFAGFIGLLGTTNSALATPVVKPETKPLVSNSLKQPVSLDVSNSLWQLTDRDAKDIFDHLGCCCAACSQTLDTDI